MEEVPDGFLLESRAISMMDLGHMFLKSDHVVGKKVARQLELPAQVFTVRIVPPSVEEATKCGKSISFSCPQARCPEDFILPGQGAEGGVKAALCAHLQNSWHLLGPLICQKALSIGALPATQDCDVSPEATVVNIFAKSKGQSRGAKLFLARGLPLSRCPVNSH